jgi:hypothetical protein
VFNALRGPIAALFVRRFALLSILFSVPSAADDIVSEHPNAHVRLDLVAEMTCESSRRYLGSCHEAEQWTKAHEREWTCEMETGNGRFKIDI